MSPKKLTLFASLGMGLEYYDFVIYGLLANNLGQAFFPAADPIAATIQALAIFALGYIARPMGGLILGHLGDRYGRRNIFLISLMLMALATLGIGILPTYHHIGLTATVLLILLRILQGFAYGAELPGSITFLSEHLRHRRGIYIGFAMSSLSIGAALASGVLFVLNLWLTPSQMASYGWRLPFLLGGLLIIFSYLIRRRMQETPLFLQTAATQPIAWPVLELLKKFGRQVVIGLAISLFTACFIVFAISLPVYLQTFYHYSASQSYLAIFIGLIASAFMLPFFGYLADRVGRARLLLLTALLSSVCSAALFSILNQQTMWALIIFIILYQAIIAALGNCYLPVLAELFPTRVRFTGVALCYNTVYSLASFTPFLLNQASALSGNTHNTSWFFSLLAVTTVVACFFINKNVTGELDATKQSEKTIR